MFCVNQLLMILPEITKREIYLERNRQIYLKIDLTYIDFL